MQLYYKVPAQSWNEALPIGNGHLAGMVYGDPLDDTVELNDETIWYRGAVDRNNPDSVGHLQEIRRLIALGKVKEAESLEALSMYAVPRDQSHYEVLGELFIHQNGFSSDEVMHYSRRLDLNDAAATVQFEAQDTTYTRQYITSFNRNMMIIRFTTSNTGALSLNFSLGRKKRFSDGITKFQNNGIIMTGNAGGDHGVRFHVGLRVLQTDGEVSVIGETITVRHATHLDIGLVTSTNYRQPGGEMLIAGALTALDDMAVDQEVQHSVERYQRQYNRVGLQITEDSDSEQTTTERLAAVQQGHQDNYLLNLLWNYGRYLLISASQPGGLPANLQGIWCDDLNPIWGSKYTININTEMNYWMVGPCDLPETELPLFDMLEHMRQPGRVTAKTMYGARGFTAHHNTDGFFDTAPQSHTIGASVWPLTIPWLLTHIWEYYQYFGDLNLVKQHYAMFKEAALFFEDYLFEHNGYLMTGPSASPENRYRLPDGQEANVTFSPTIDNQILRFFFECCIDFANLVHDDSDFVAKIRAMKNKLPPTKVGKHGQIQEWIADYDEVEVGHRHISPLFGLHPGHEIDVDKTPELAKAAAVTIKRRLSNGHYLDASTRDKAISDWTSSGLSANTRTGWSLAWLVHFYARLRQGNNAYGEIQGLMAHSILPNLFCDHPPFQIDGNYGVVSGICEMLLQSQNDQILILPALPKEIPNGSFTGFRVRGGQKVSVSWSNGFVRKVTIQGKPNESVQIRILGERLEQGIEKNVDLTLDSKGVSELSF